MLTLEALLADIGGRPDPAELLRDFVPPPRFANKDFESYRPRHPSQGVAVGRLGAIAAELTSARRGWSFPGFTGRRHSRGGAGVYLDGGFGVGKTHLLAALWNAGPAPKSYLSFDELMYFVGLLGPAAASQAFKGRRLIAVDEWELDDPGNLTLALAFLRGALDDGAFVAVTSNTLPLELGAGRFSQKDFRAEVEELAAGFEVVRIEGEDYRHRHFTMEPGRTAAADPDVVARRLAKSPEETLRTSFPLLMAALGTLHPIRFRELARRLDCLILERIDPLPNLADALRWVHFIDSLYVSGTAVMTEEPAPLTNLFAEEAVAGPFGKKLMRCLSRLEELLGHPKTEMGMREGNGNNEEVPSDNG